MNAKSIRNLYLKRGSYWFARQVAGVRKWVNLETGDLSEALRRLSEIQFHPLIRPEHHLRAEVRRFIDYKLRMNEWSAQSADSKRWCLDRFAAELPATFTAKSVNTTHIAQFYARLQRDVTESTAQGYMMTLRSFFAWAVEIERVRLDNPVAKVRLARLDRRGRQRFCTLEQKSLLIERAPDDDLRFILFSGFDAGLRKAEIIEARADWFDLGAGMLHVRQTPTFRTKDREERSVPLTAPFREFLQKYLAQKPEDAFALMPGVAHGKWRYRYDFRRPFAAYMTAQGCAWVTPHVMRHSFASILASAGKSIFKIAEWLGDDVRVVQRHYAKLCSGDDDIHALTLQPPPAARRASLRARPPRSVPRSKACRNGGR